MDMAAKYCLSHRDVCGRGSCVPGALPCVGECAPGSFYNQLNLRLHLMGYSFVAFS